ncbi:conserved hypothetical protein [Maribacter litoralis]|uniref:Uncharacterized protein n=3 Tax=Flavobacteriaceae TaxID=49546 RepID=A0A653TRF1_9FLAO|nr:conserved hypothetical protein [Maribacter litoralis]
MHLDFDIFVMMKSLSFILAVLMLTLTAKPCSDGQNFEDQQQEELSLDHNHQDDNDDSCPITCICSCCGMSIAYEPLTPFEFTFHSSISTLLTTNYQSIYRFDFHSNIWQPPQA